MQGFAGLGYFNRNPWGKTLKKKQKLVEVQKTEVETKKDNIRNKKARNIDLVMGGRNINIEIQGRLPIDDAENSNKNIVIDDHEDDYEEEDALSYLSFLTRAFQPNKHEKKPLKSPKMSLYEYKYKLNKQRPRLKSNLKDKENRKTEFPVTFRNNQKVNIENNQITKTFHPARLFENTKNKLKSFQNTFFAQNRKPDITVKKYRKKNSKDGLEKYHTTPLVSLSHGQNYQQKMIEHSTAKYVEESQPEVSFFNLVPNENEEMLEARANVFDSVFFQRSSFEFEPFQIPDQFRGFLNKSPNWFGSSEPF